MNLSAHGDVALHHALAQKLCLGFFGKRDEAGFVQEAVKTVLGAYAIDKRRVVLHGMGLGGEMAYYLAFHNRDLYRALATDDPGPFDAATRYWHERTLLDFKRSGVDRDDATRDRLVSASLDRTVRIWSLPELRLGSVLRVPMEVQREGELVDRLAV